MHNEVVTKKSPVILMIKLAVIEAGGILLYFIATLFGNYKFELYSQLSLTNILPYESAKPLVLFGAQFALTAYAFLLWYYEEYKIKADSIVHLHGVFQRKKTSFVFDKSCTVLIQQNLLGKIFHYGNIVIQHGKNTFALKTISRPELLIRAIQEGPMSAKFSSEHNIEKLLNSEENDWLEFKSSLRYDYKAGNVSRELEKAALKTVAAFLNSKGGYLIVGVNDERNPLGLEKDFQTLQRKDKDGFENHFTQAFNAVIGPEFRDLVKIKFMDVGGNDVCLVEALPSHRPVYFKSDNNEHFYMRTGNITSALKLSEMESYIRSRWPKL